MTIPRIGDKIVRVKNPAVQVSPQPNAAEDVHSPSGNADYEEASLDDMFGEEQQSTSQTKPETDTVQKPTPAPVVKNRHSEDDYSIDQFTKDYMEKFHDDVLPMLLQYEPERKQRLLLAVLLGTICVLIGIFLLFFTEADGRISASMFGLAGLCWFLIKKSFEKKIKRKVMPLLMKAVPDFYWQLEPPIPVDDITECMIFPNAKNASKSFDDAFLGKYRGVDISIAECKYTANKSTIFSGAVIRIKMNKDFEGVTIIRPKKHVAVKNANDLKKLHLQKIELEDVEFNQEYNVYSTDQVEARYLLTTSFMERFKNIYTAFNSKAAYCSFYGKYVYIAPYCNDDLFSICSLVRDVADEQQFMKLIEELTSILALIDHFKLDKKLGL